MSASDFHIDWQIDVDDQEGTLEQEAETRLMDLAAEHTDIVGAAIAITAAAQTPEQSPILYQARVAVYVRPEEVVGHKQDDNPMGALKAALSAVERQVRERRTKLAEPWKRSDFPDAPGSDTE